MIKRKLLILGGVLLVGCIALTWAMLFKPFEGGPRYKGLPVSYWKNAVVSGYGAKSLTGRLETLIGLRDESGTPAIFGGTPSDSLPVLLRVYFDDDAGVRSAMGNWFEAVNERVRIYDARTHREIVKTLRAIGPKAAPAVPMLMQFLKDETVAAEAVEALREIDPEAARRAGVK